jgi:hypothetical protein
MENELLQYGRFPMIVPRGYSNPLFLLSDERPPNPFKAYFMPPRRDSRPLECLLDDEPYYR